MEHYSRIIIITVIVSMMISSPIFMLLIPAQVSAATINDNSNIIDSSSFHSTPRVPETALPSSATIPASMATSSTPSQDSDFTTQAALTLTRSAQTSNFVLSKGYYDISFRTATAGAIKTITMDFPADTFVGSAGVVEVVGIGPGTLAASAGGVLTYTVTNAVNVPALTNIRIQISNINNPTPPSASYAVSITTRNTANAIIDGPTNTFAYNIVQVGNAQIAPGAVTVTKIAPGAVTANRIADGAVTSTKPAESFMKRVTVDDTFAGNQVGWNPDGSRVTFTITESEVSGPDFSFVSVIVDTLGTDTNFFCDTVKHFPGAFRITCSSPPPNGSFLNYVVENLPSNIIS
jgi:hypothetical protein